VTWKNVTPKEMPDFGRVSQIDASKFNAGTAYISVRKPLLNDQAPYIFKTSDYGRTWTKIINGIRSDAYVHAVREDPFRKGLLYAATQHGVYMSYDDGANWDDLSLNMPDVPVSDLIVTDNELAIATHGRGFWILDNVAPLRQATPAILAADAYLFAPPPAIRSGTPVAFTYKLTTVPKRLELAILDSAGGVMRSFIPDTAGAVAGAPRAGGRRGGAAAPLPNKIGLNRYTWDLRTVPIESFPGMILWGAGTNGPVVPPGKYTVRLIADGKTMTAPLVVKRNPLITDVTDADLRAQYAFGRKVRDKATEANMAVIQIRRVKAQLADRLKRAADDAALKEKGATLDKDATGVETSVYQTKNQSGQDPLNFPIRVNNRIANLLSMSERGDGPPNQSLPEIYGILTKELKGYTDRLDTVWNTDLVAVNKELVRLKLPPINPLCAKAEGCTAVP
jgi:hypothetical protein